MFACTIIVSIFSFFGSRFFGSALLLSLMLSVKFPKCVTLPSNLECSTHMVLVDTSQSFFSVLRPLLFTNVSLLCFHLSK